MLPLEFVKRMENQLGLSESQDFFNALNSPAPISIRINKQKFKNSLNLEKVKWSSDGYYLPSRPLFASDPLWHAGVYYVQEASSMAIEQAFLAIKKSLKTNLKILDLCAAPGGKSTHLLNLMDVDDVLISNEVIQSRVGVLQENIRKSGYSNVVITNQDSSQFNNLKNYFDLVLVDAPCSGEGLFRKDIQAVQHWNDENLKTCELRQKRILSDIIQSVKSGGYIIYSTCTFNPKENEAQLDYLISNGFEPVNFVINGKENYVHSFLPHQCVGEGFFIGLLKKTGWVNESEMFVKNKFTIEKVSQSYLKNQDQMLFVRNGNIKIGLTEATFKAINHLPFHLVSFGVECVEMKSQLELPKDYLAFSNDFNQSLFPVIDLDLKQAINYISSQSISIKLDWKGYISLCFRGYVIGIGKSIGNRINNLFPNPWKLKKEIKESEYFTLID